MVRCPEGASVPCFSQRHVGLGQSPYLHKVSVGVYLPQRGQQFTAQGSAWQHIQAHIDGLRRDVLSHVVRTRASEASGNLLGRAARRQMRPHILSQPRVEEFPRAPWVSGFGRPLGSSPYTRDRDGPVWCSGPTRGSRCWGHVPIPRHRSERMAMGQAQAHGFTFFGTHVSIGSCSHGNTVAH